jgi:hypothetical protein
MKLFGRRVPDIEVDLHPAQDDEALRRAYAAAQGGDWIPARELMAATGSDHDRRARYIWVLAESTEAVWDSDRSGADTTSEWTDRWADDEPDNADALLLRARSLIKRGWDVRGSGWASSVGNDSFAEFHRLLRLALPLVDRAAALSPGDPSPWVHRLLLAVALQAGREQFERLWSEVVARDPGHREAHNFKLMYLCEKWHGSHDEMFAFARAAAASAPDGSPLHVLPVQANAEWALWENRDGSLASLRRVADVWKGNPGFHAELDQALHRWFAKAPRRHAMWYHDLNYLAYGLSNGRRHADAKPVFEAIGRYMESVPWAWADRGDSNAAFRFARREALRT